MTPGVWVQRLYSEYVLFGTMWQTPPCEVLETYFIDMCPIRPGVLRIQVWQAQSMIQNRFLSKMPSFPPSRLTSWCSQMRSSDSLLGTQLRKQGCLWLSSLPESSLTAQIPPAGLTPLHPYCLGSHWTLVPCLLKSWRLQLWLPLHPFTCLFCLSHLTKLDGPLKIFCIWGSSPTFVLSPAFSKTSI